MYFYPIELVSIYKRGMTAKGFVNPLLYNTYLSSYATFHDILTGSNGAYTATKGGDLCVGLGTYTQ
jgi:hypothetical protein